MGAAAKAGVAVAVWGMAAAASAQVVEYYHVDAVGSIRALTSQGGQVIERHDYLPFGEECTTGPCASNPGLNAGQPRKYTGKERDKETGFDYFGARYYGSRIGRFTTTDPVYTWRENLVDPQRWNRYAYARNNPLRYVDPDGKAVLPAAALGAVIGGALGFGGSVFTQYVHNGSFANLNYADARAAMYGGAVSGGLAGGTLGLSALAGAGIGTVAAVNAGANVAGGAVARATDSSADTKAFAGTEAVIDAGVGGVGGVVGFGVQRSVVPEVAHLAQTRAGMQAAARAGNHGAGAGARGIGRQIGNITLEAEVGATVAGAQVTNQAAPIVREVAAKRERSE